MAAVERRGSLLRQRPTGFEPAKHRQRVLHVAPILDRLQQVGDRILGAGVVRRDRRLTISFIRFEPPRDDSGREDRVAIGVGQQDRPGRIVAVPRAIQRSARFALDTSRAIAGTGA